VAGGGLAILKRNKDGSLEQLEGEAGCLQRTFRSEVEDCGRARAINGARSVAVAPDGGTVFVAATGSDAIATFRRDRTTGALSQLPGAAGCVSYTGTHGCARARPLRDPHELALSPDGRSLYVSSSFAVTAFSLRAGTPERLAGTHGCARADNRGGCLDGRGINDRELQLAVSADGRNLYVGSYWGRLAIFRIR
jgi:sugar lactone lactonase YvrE